MTEIKVRDWGGLIGSIAVRLRQAHATLAACMALYGYDAAPLDFSWTRGETPRVSQHVEQRCLSPIATVCTHENLAHNHPTGGSDRSSFSHLMKEKVTL